MLRKRCLIYILLMHVAVVIVLFVVNHKLFGQVSRKLLIFESVPFPTTATPTPSLQVSTPNTTTKNGQKMCSANDRRLVGLSAVNKSIPSMKEVTDELSVAHGGFVEFGGAYKPKDCISKYKVAIIIPYRQRADHLKAFLRHMHPILQRQKLNYQIFVIEQAGYFKFNRAMLFNCAFFEIEKMFDYNCMVLHDVDHMLENDRNFYGCTKAPILLGVVVQKEQYRTVRYGDFFGGVVGISKEQYQKSNGFSNVYWGWGGEDDDLYTRVKSVGYKMSRSSQAIGRYVTLTFQHTKANPNPARFTILSKTTARMKTDGLNSLHYTLIGKTMHSLYTHYLVELPHP